MISLYFLPILLATLATAYIPASPTNSSQDATANGFNLTDTSQLTLHWYPNGTLTVPVSYRIPGNGSQGIDKGVFVHFSEASVNELTPPTSTPWIAMVSCDANITGVSQEVDVFTLAKRKGATAALLYSLYSLACIVNPGYVDSTTNHTLDVFVAQGKTDAQLIGYQFGQLFSTGGITNYDSQHLNNTAGAVEDSIARDSATAPGFLYASLISGAMGEANTTDVNYTNDASPNAGSIKTALAMCVLTSSPESRVTVTDVPFPGLCSMSSQGVLPLFGIR
ncbi:hypothetical protein P691DRAFT_727178 [Macrolepiota fuliginosa MF-IS2]|uniref:Uncharacterized protein n=1 Tax=Macrolepiota fuliginosa MF-IS2 TaxID=1400762 RepID=A0A9P5XGC6_9AGAR|nr:hypothetical protein P691DRAFT_727178 [Macrolepiota fuliginosa MF-IS2]